MEARGIHAVATRATRGGVIFVTDAERPIVDADAGHIGLGPGASYVGGDHGVFAESHAQQSCAFEMSRARIALRVADRIRHVRILHDRHRICRARGDERVAQSDPVRDAVSDSRRLRRDRLGVRQPARRHRYRRARRRSVHPLSGRHVAQPDAGSRLRLERVPGRGLDRSTRPGGALERREGAFQHGHRRADRAVPAGHVVLADLRDHRLRCGQHGLDNARRQASPTTTTTCSRRMRPTDRSSSSAIDRAVDNAGSIRNTTNTNPPRRRPGCGNSIRRAAGCS